MQDTDEQTKRGITDNENRTGVFTVDDGPQVDTDSDSWDSGDNQPDVIDEAEYDSPEEPLDESVEGDEEDLGNEADGEPDPDSVDLKLEKEEPLDDEYIDDRGFDCD